MSVFFWRLCLLVEKAKKSTRVFNRGGNTMPAIDSLNLCRGRREWPSGSSPESRITDLEYNFEVNQLWRE
jgi:hypothetical protein